MRQTILVVDDELGPRESLKTIFAKKYDVELAENCAQAMEKLSARKIDLILLDVILPDRSGIDLLQDIQEQHPHIPVVMISATSSLRTVVESMRVGALDYVAKPFDVQELLRIVSRALDSTRLHRQVEALESEVAREFPVDHIVGDAPEFRSTLDQLRKAADTGSTVLLCGESGTGKELAARMLHSCSARKDEPFVAIHCAALSESLMESELFGHEKGAFTGADKRKHGRFDLAESGTIFFDEVGEMPLSTQVKLLRVLEEREFMRVGGTRTIRTHARIVAATGLDLRAAAQKKRFREDLFYRLSVIPVTLPPLRRRTGDIPLLLNHFLNKFSRSIPSRARRIDPEAMDRLCRYDWPGNIRELRNIVERVLVLHPHAPVVLPQFLPEEFQRPIPAAAPVHSGGTLQSRINAFERALIEQALHEANGNQTRAAQNLGTTRRILRYRMKKLDIPANNGMSNENRPSATPASPRNPA